MPSAHPPSTSSQVRTTYHTPTPVADQHPRMQVPPSRTTAQHVCSLFFIYPGPTTHPSPCLLLGTSSGWFDVTAQNAMKLAHHMDGLVDDVQLVIAAWNHGGIQHARFWQGGVRKL